MGLLLLFLSCNLKYLHDCCFISFDNVAFEKLSSHPPLFLRMYQMPAS